MKQVTSIVGCAILLIKPDDRVGMLVNAHSAVSHDL